MTRGFRRLPGWRVGLVLRMVGHCAFFNYFFLDYQVGAIVIPTMGWLRRLHMESGRDHTLRQSTRKLLVPWPASASASRHTSPSMRGRQRAAIFPRSGDDDAGENSAANVGYFPYDHPQFVGASAPVAGFRARCSSRLNPSAAFRGHLILLLRARAHPTRIAALQSTGMSAACHVS